VSGPFRLASGGNDDFAMLDGDAHSLTGKVSGVFDPSTGEHDPRLARAGLTEAR
jgi:hypothetical protein